MKSPIFNTPPNSYWIASTEETSYPSLNHNIDTDAAIIGGGIVGITCAYLLKKSGLKVALIESGRILKGTTGHTTAKVTSQHDFIYDTLINKFGLERARQYADANQSAIELIDAVSKENGIDCDFLRKSAYLYTQSDKYVQNITKEVEAAKKLGINAELADRLPLPFQIKCSMVFHNQAQFHPRKYLLGLSKIINSDECNIFENTCGLDIEKGDKITVYTNTNNKITASHVVIATHYPFFDGMGLYFARIYPDRSYALGIKTASPFPDGMFINAETTTRSLRSQPFGDDELIIVGGDGHKTGQGPNMSTHYTNLVDYANSLFDKPQILYRWSTQDYISMDSIPYVGPITSEYPNVYVATGFRKWGMTNGTASAVIIHDLIVKGSSQWSDVYSPSRFTPAASAKRFAIENANVAKQLVIGKLQSVPNDVDIDIGEGKVVEIDGNKVGIYKDENGKLHIVDTKCPHLGCELQWNSAEYSWDCPCHGSRFTYEGEILNGPALKSLDNIKNDSL